MIYKHMYCGYKNGGELEFCKDERIITASAAGFEDMTFLYFETKEEDLGAQDVVKADMRPFPNGEDWFEMTEIFHYFTPREDGEWERRVPNKKPWFRINKLRREKISSYIYYHMQYQLGNPYDCDKFMSIFIYGDTIIMYGENPEEKITWQDIEGKYHLRNRDDWGDLMNEHFAFWPDGKQKWVAMELENQIQ